MSRPLGRYIVNGGDSHNRHAPWSSHDTLPEAIAAAKTWAQTYEADQGTCWMATAIGTEDDHEP